jgi:hypothetical protein
MANRTIGDTSRASDPAPRPAPQRIRELGLLALILFPILRWLAHGDARAVLDRRLKYTRRERDNRKAERDLKRDLKRDARRYGAIMVSSWSQMGLAHVESSVRTPDVKRVRRHPKTQRVKFRVVSMAADVIAYQIMVSKRTLFGWKNMLPYRTYTRDLTDEVTLDQISHACRRVVTADANEPRKGLWIKVWRGQGVGGLPTKLAFKDVLVKYPAGDPAPLVLGGYNNREVFARSLTHNPHMLIGGPTGSGKSNLLNNIICGLIRNISSDDLKLILFDRKMMELSLYEDVPHVMRMEVSKEGITRTLPRVISDTDDTIDALEWLEREMRRRNTLFSRKAKELASFNKRYPDQALPRLVALLDEFADYSLMRDKKKARIILDLVTRLISQGRAVGIHLIVCTQAPYVSVIPGEIQANFSIKVAGRTANATQSRVIIGVGDAAFLPEVPGRMIAMIGATSDIIQTPFISEEDIEESVAIARGKALNIIRMEGIEPVVNPIPLLEYVATILGGSLALSDLTGPLREFAITRKMIQAWIGGLNLDDLYMFGERHYQIKRRGSGFRIEAVDETKPVPAPVTVPTITDPRRLLVASIPIRAPEPETPLFPEPIEAFIKACCVVSLHSWTAPTPLYRAYEQWCVKQSIVPVRQNEFGVWLKDRGFKPVRRHEGRIWIGIELLPELQESVA